MTSNTDVVWGNRAAKVILLIRILVGWVFLSEGIQKFLFPESLGVGRFVKIGIPLPQLMAPFVGVTEIICGALLLVGLFTRLACVPLLIDICAALYSTKIITFMKNGFWGTLHEARTDVSMLLGLIFLLLVGGGTLALDARYPEGWIQSHEDRRRAGRDLQPEPSRRFCRRIRGTHPNNEVKSRIPTFVFLVWHNLYNKFWQRIFLLVGKELPNVAHQVCSSAQGRSLCANGRYAGHARASVGLF